MADASQLVTPFKVEDTHNDNEPSIGDAFPQILIGLAGAIGSFWPYVLQWYYPGDGSYISQIGYIFTNYYFSARTMTILIGLSLYNIELALFLFSWFSLDFLYVFAVFSDFTGYAASTLCWIPIIEHLVSLARRENIYEPMTNRNLKDGSLITLSFSQNDRIW